MRASIHTLGLTGVGDDPALTPATFETECMIVIKSQD